MSYLDALVDVSDAACCCCSVDVVNELLPVLVGTTSCCLLCFAPG